VTILTIDDDPTQIELLRAIFRKIAYPAIEHLYAETAAGGLDLVERKVIDLILTDLHLPDGSGLEILRRVKSLNPMISVVVMTAYDDTREAVSILKEGADDYIIKPTRAEEIERLVIRINERSVLIHEAFLPPNKGAVASPATAGIIYSSASMASVMSMASRSADSDATVLISGESGTGKELVARFIHQRAARRKGAFVAVNISALPESLVESELFGHSKGAFTGAGTERMGRFEEADGGTLFLDEIGDITPALQVKLLRTIQFGEVERVGENTARRLDVRIVAATNRDLKVFVATGKFRSDLFYRINVIDILVPPLRDRKEDIKLLIEHFIARFNERNNRHIRGFSREALDRLMRHSFPGNIRELENIIERTVVLCRGDLILESDLPILEEKADPSLCMDAQGGYEVVMERFERDLLEKAISRNNGNHSAAARELGITERHIRSRLYRLGMK
jgi:DNA-binding NtrC family response regulator